MAKIKSTTSTTLSTEQKIRAAAKKIFTEKGFWETRTRDIAKEAGINLALLNYYFRGKDKLYASIAMENLSEFATGIALILKDRDKTINDKITELTSNYIDLLCLNPELPWFIIVILRRDSALTLLPPEMLVELKASKVFFMHQIKRELKNVGVTNPKQRIKHLITNFIGLAIFPFVAKSALKKMGQLSDQEFVDMMQERKKLIPIWLQAMLQN